MAALVASRHLRVRLLPVRRSSSKRCKHIARTSDLKQVPLVKEDSDNNPTPSPTDAISNISTDYASSRSTTIDSSPGTSSALATPTEPSALQWPPSTVAAGAALAVLAAYINQDWVSSHQTIALGSVFLAGYTAITVEELVGLDKAATSLLMAVTLWTVRAINMPNGAINPQAAEALSEVSEVLFFLIGAMAIVEVVDANGGFQAVSRALPRRDLRQLTWAVGLTTFLLSAMLDNLTSTIVMVSILQRICPNAESRRFLGAVVVIAANAGGAWSPIGDVTTTMMWIGGQLSAVPTIQSLLLPSLVSLVLPLAAITQFAPEVQAALPAPTQEEQEAGGQEEQPGSMLIGAAGLSALLAAPAIRAATGLPPYMGILGGLAALWAITDALHAPSNKDLRVAGALQRIDTPGVLFFFGVLMSVAALDSAGLLAQLATALDSAVPSREALAACIGLLSAVVDNVPLVAASMGMYSMADYPVDDRLWQLVAYCAGTGGSMLVIGSAAGVAYMGLVEGVTFGWYLRKITPWALLGYLGGLGVYLAQAGVAQ